MGACFPGKFRVLIMPKKKTASYLTVKPEAADRLRKLGFVTLGNQVPANRAARQHAKHVLGLNYLPGPTSMPIVKEKKNAT